MPGVRHLGCCPVCGGTVPDDGTGCCSYLPETDIPGSLDLTTYDEFGTPVDSATIPGPFVYYPGDVQISKYPRFGAGVHPTYIGEDGYYIAGPVCLTDRQILRFQVGGEFGEITTDQLYNRRYYAILACCWNSDTETSASKKVRLILVSNLGQYADTSEGAPATCDDQAGGPFGDFADGWDWTVDPMGTDLIVSDGAFVVNERRSSANPGGYLATCDPLCLVFDGSGPGPGLGGPLAFEGSAGEVPCSVPDPDDCACTTTITMVSYCPDDCPTEGGELWSFYARDDVTNEDFGPGLVQWARNEAEECLVWSATVEVCLPPDEITGLPPESRTFSLRKVEIGEADVDLGDAVVEDCQPVVIAEGLPPDYFTVRFRLIGCPAPEVLPDAEVSVQLRHTTGELVDSRAATTLSNGVGYATFRLPNEAGNYRFDLVVAQPYPGYAGTVTISPEALPAAGSECFELDLGDVTAPVDDDHICTCGGLVQKCITWDGNGDPAELTWTGGTTWEGAEDGLTGRNPGAGFCSPGTTDAAPIGITLWIDEECEWRAERDMEICDDTDRAGVCGAAAPSLSGAGGVAETTRAVPVPVTVWGPINPFPGVTLSSWVDSGGAADPNACNAPPEGYEPAEANNCTTPMMAFVAPELMEATVPRLEPPLPSIGRMAGQLVRSAGRVVARKARGGKTLASTATQEARWSSCKACDHYRASDQRCGKVDGCGCYLAQKIPLASSSCPIGTWGPEPISGGDPPPEAGPPPVAGPARQPQ